jgi:hypothetical protein
VWCSRIHAALDTLNIPDIIKRAAGDIMPDETHYDETNPNGNGWASSVTVIDPRIDIDDGLTIHPGLISIAIDYGWLCARDVVGTSTDRRMCEQVTDRLTLFRKRILEIEERGGGRKRLACSLGVQAHNPAIKSDRREQTPTAVTAIQTVFKTDGAHQITQRCCVVQSQLRSLTCRKQQDT